MGGVDGSRTGRGFGEQIGSLQVSSVGVFNCLCKNSTGRQRQERMRHHGNGTKESTDRFGRVRPHAYGAGRRHADQRCHLVFTGHTSMLHTRRFCKSRISRPGCSFLCVCTLVCYTRRQKPTLTPKRFIS